MAAESGEEAEDAWTRQYPAAVEELVGRHEEMAEWIARVAAGIAVLIAIGAVRWKPARHGATWLALLAAMGLAGWTAYTAHLGGTMVYEYGVGTAGLVSGGAGTRSDDGAITDEAETADDPRVAFFREKVHPILEANCMRCHKPSRLRRVAGLDQTTISGLLIGGESGPALIPGDPDGSLIIRAARHDPELDLDMPPDDDKLPEESIAILEEWVRDGAVWSLPGS